MFLCYVRSINNDEGLISNRNSGTTTLGDMMFTANAPDGEMKFLQTELGNKCVDVLLKILASKSHMNRRQVAAKTSPYEHPNLTAVSANDGHICGLRLL